jgi:hypothetical protein
MQAAIPDDNIARSLARVGPLIGNLLPDGRDPQIFRIKVRVVQKITVHGLPAAPGSGAAI